MRNPSKYERAYRERGRLGAEVRMALAGATMPPVEAQPSDDAIDPPPVTTSEASATSSPGPARAALQPLVPVDGRVALEFAGSSNIRGAVLEVATSTLEVTFAKGPRWRYANVTPAMLEEWRAAPSAGRWFHGAIKSRPQAHPATPIEDAAAPGA